SQTPYSSNNFLTTLPPPILKSVTVRSKTKTYKHKVAVSDTTTFSSLIKFAINATEPPNKKFVIRSADNLLEYIPDDLVRKVTTGVEYTEIVVSLEDTEVVYFGYF